MAEGLHTTAGNGNSKGRGSQGLNLFVTCTPEPLRSHLRSMTEILSMPFRLSRASPTFLQIFFCRKLAVYRSFLVRKSVCARSPGLAPDQVHRAGDAGVVTAHQALQYPAKFRGIGPLQGTGQGV